MRPRDRLFGAIAAAAVLAVALPGTGVGSPPAAAEPAIQAPNIVVIMVDDMSAEIADYMDAVQALRAGGVSFSNYFVSNSLCCPSRATFLTGKYPHNSKVEGNYWPQGGFARFYKHDSETSIAPYLSAVGYRTGLIGKYLNEYDPAGDTDGVKPPDYPPAYVPPGWDEWFSTGWGYQQFDYQAVDSVDGVTRLVDYTGGREENYLTDVMSARAGEFIHRAVEGVEPFFLTLTPFAVHSARLREDPQQPEPPHFPPAPRDRADSPNRPPDWGEVEFPSGDCGGPAAVAEAAMAKAAVPEAAVPQAAVAQAAVAEAAVAEAAVAEAAVPEAAADGGCDQVAFPDPSWGSFNQPVTDPARDMPTEPLPQERLDSMQADHLERVQSAQAVDDLVESVRADLVEAGVADETYVIFTSDNGFHLGEHALGQGKGTAYDHDIRVPLIVYPPGGTAPKTKNKIVQNTDLLPTLLEIAGATVPDDVDGVSLLNLIEGAPADRAGKWRRAGYVAYRGFQDRPDERVSSVESNGQTLDPDRADLDRVPAYHALRAANYLYVDYSTLDSASPRSGRAEYFDLQADPYELHNVYASLSRKQRTSLNETMINYSNCAGSECWQAGLDAPRH